jgi:hypothetical protein
MRSGPSRIATRQDLQEGSSPRPPMRERVDEGKQWASYALLSAKETVADLYRTTRCLAEKVKQEHPLQLLTVIAGSAIVVGVAARIWRSRHHA